ncbi:MAG: extracellular repeat-containing protein HAF family [Limisphaerales bacterium]|nr:MAG: extracellular repeat-containing protein HAF family [Limisphaerales bacterium]KAG0508835.1 MAG: extracellular repeat-containing protein HAF family [Limisphaerales bacterium]TXT49706.1 MAG: extracellular repeat-containing protein HAF family [Limisphaerales bacterium]
MPLPRHVRTGCLLLVAGLVLGGAAARGQGAFYQLTDLGALGAPADKPAALNRAGVVVGTRSPTGREGSSSSRAFIFTNAFHELGPAGTPTFASDLNEPGDAVGWCRLAQAGGRFVDRAVLWQKGQHIELGTLGGPNSRAFAINERVDITGAAQTMNGAFHAFLWRQGKLEDLGTLGGRNSYGHAINSAFDIAGVAETAQQVRHAFLHTGGKMRDLGTLGGLLSQANGLNEAGDVVGFAQNATGQSRAFLHTKGKMSDLGTLGGPGAFANAINNRLHVVGAAQLATGENRAFLWRDGKLSNLNQFLPPNPGWFLLEATDINESGQILCLARTKNGQLRAVRLTPPGAGAAGADR